MSFDRTATQNAIAKHGPVIRIVVADHAGSTPRDTGTSMMVWANGSEGTIGGGALELEAIAQARAMLLEQVERHIERVPLGPSRGQCCGGAVTLFYERFSRTNIVFNETVFARPTTPDAPVSPPLGIQRALKAARNQGISPQPELIDGWMIEPLRPAAHALWIYGAGHVGRALINVLHPMPDFEITWVDTALNRFPDGAADTIRVLPASDPCKAASLAPRNAHHLILTYSHSLDLSLCHQVLGQGFGWAGLIGSHTKWARFQRRLRGLGHESDQILRICCPIGRPELGKHPAAIAVGVAEQLLLTLNNTDAKTKIGGATG